MLSFWSLLAWRPKWFPTSLPDALYNDIQDFKKAGAEIPEAYRYAEKVCRANSAASRLFRAVEDHNRAVEELQTLCRLHVTDADDRQRAKLFDDAVTGLGLKKILEQVPSMKKLEKGN